ncbi:hypothetical protein Patl1_01269 [Pistacia atlantica]|uniref:Uncharacterized protein n=1 Tax=Pistacia atlantica TaxID=434234 RepID=A0ACC1C454_9ROSI|nr:hypothetical protein Patl1_01269 [Pistacia atlantica]
MDGVQVKGKKSQIVKSWKRCLSPRARRSNDKCCCDSLAKSKSWNCAATSSSLSPEKEKTGTQVAPEGCFTVYVGPEKQRFVIKTQYANHPLFKILLEDAESEYGFNSQGPILLPCDVDLFYKVLAEMESGGDKNIDPAGFGCGKGYSPFLLFSPSRRPNFNVNKGYGAYRLLSPSRKLKRSLSSESCGSQSLHLPSGISSGYLADQDVFYGTNYLNWTTQFIPVLRSHDLLSIVDGSEECPPQYLGDSTEKSTSDINPQYLVWQKKDQFILAWLNATLREKILSAVYGLTTSKMVWNTLASRFAPQSRSRISHLKRQLQTLQQGNKTCFDYLLLAKSWPDQLTAASKSVDEKDLISYVVGGLNPIYNPFITSFNFATRDKSISFDDFQSELLNYEQLLDSQNKSRPSDGTQFAFFTNKPKFHHGKKPKYPTQEAKSPSSPKPNPTTTPAYPSSKPQPSGSPFFSTKFPPCQICGKPNHQDLQTKQILLQGQSEVGLYPLYLK